MWANGTKTWMAGVMAENNCLVLGDIAIDFNMQTEAYPAEGGAAHAAKADFRLGGSGCLTAVVLQNLGCPTALAANLGSDLFADFVAQKIQAAGLDTTFTRQLPNQQTGFFMIATTPNGAHTTFGNRGANALPLPEAQILARLAEFQHLHISGYTLLDEEQFAVVRRILIQAKMRGLTTSLDPGVCISPSACENVLSLLMHINYFLPNTDELERLGGAGTIHDQIETVLNHGCEAVIVKMGEKGSRYYDNNEALQQKPNADTQAKIVDTTGAGDCFNAGFLASILKGEALKTALQAGHAAAYRMITSPHGILDFIHS